MGSSVIKRSPGFWHRYFMDIAARTAQLSKDPDRKVGALLVSADKRQMSAGYNGLPSNVADNPEILYDKERKNELIVHAEENALRQAPFMTWGCSLYVTRFPCLRCAQLILKADVREVIAPKPDFIHPRWGLSWTSAFQVLRQGNVRVTWDEEIQL